MSIREATLNDVEAILPLFDAYRVFYEQTSDLDGAAQCLKENLSCQRSHIFVFEDNETVLGFTQLYPAFCSVEMQPFFVLYDLYVVPTARAKGVGTSLLRFAHDWAKAQGASRVDLETAHTNVTAQSIYEALGYELDIEFRKYSLDLACG
jgi:ribosomal protein S18 acetylase RimI-like enzyme